MDKASSQILDEVLVSELILYGSKLQKALIADLPGLSFWSRRVALSDLCGRTDLLNL